VYVDGKKTVTLRGARIAEEFQAIVEDYVARRFSAGNPVAQKKIPIKAV
jgi:(E)-4-hydroxy-3-methylbut-2-enyl-diphosphate synthase